MWWVVWNKIFIPLSLSLHLAFFLILSLLTSAEPSTRRGRKEGFAVLISTCLGGDQKFLSGFCVYVVCVCVYVCMCVFVCLVSPITTKITDLLSIVDRTATGASFPCSVTPFSFSVWSFIHGPFRGKCLATVESLCSLSTSSVFLLPLLRLSWGVIQKLDTGTNDSLSWRRCVLAWPQEGKNSLVCCVETMPTTWLSLEWDKKDK